MERYGDFLGRVSAFEVAELDLGKSYFRGRASLCDKIDEENRLKAFFGDTVVFDLDEAVKNRISALADRLYSDAGDCLAERLSGATLHMTLHDLSNGTNLSEIRGKMAENEEKIRRTSLPSRTIKMKSTFVFNMVNTSLVMGLVPANEDEHEKLMTLYGLVDEIKRAEYPLTPHITLGYYNVHGFENAAAKRLENIVGRLNRREEIEIALDTKRLYYQKFTSMNSYENVISLGKE
jgi:2'-5' RNA ligase